MDTSADRSPKRRNLVGRDIRAKEVYRPFFSIQLITGAGLAQWGWKDQLLMQGQLNGDERDKKAGIMAMRGKTERNGAKSNGENS